MAFVFTASTAAAQDDPDVDDAVVAGVAESADGTGFFLMFMCDFEEPDDLGLNDPVIEARLRAPAAQLARLRAVLPRILAFGRPAARPRLVVS